MQLTFNTIQRGLTRAILFLLLLSILPMALANTSDKKPDRNRGDHSPCLRRDYYAN